MRKIETHAGQWISEACEQAIAEAIKHGEAVQFEFNDQVIVANPNDTATALVAAYDAESQRRYDAYHASPEYAFRQQQAAERESKRRAERDAILIVAPAAMTLRDAAAWQSWVTANTDPYGHACITFAERWARLMETRIAAGESLAECAERLEHLADDEGITGFQYGCVVSMLAKAWIHGEELRRWHNHKTQVGHEGDEANESGGVLNPALLVIR